MFLYELALQLGVRSTDLVDRARDLGLDVGPSSFLGPEQVQRLTAAAAPPPPTGAPVTPAPPSAIPPPPPGPPPAGSPSMGSPPPPPPPPGAPGAGGSLGAPTPSMWSTTPRPGPTVAPPVLTGGDKKLSPGFVALYLLAPVVLLLGALVLFSGGEGEKYEQIDTSRSNVPSPQDAEDLIESIGDDEPFEVNAVGDITDLDRFCAAWTKRRPPAPDVDSPWSEFLPAVIEWLPLLIEDFDEIAASSNGELREDARAEAAGAQDLLDFYEALPLDTTALTAEQEDELAAIEASLKSNENLFDIRGEQYC